MITSTYNLCLLITNNKGTIKEGSFSVTAIQTDNMYGINIKEFSAIEEHAITEAEILYKLKEGLPFAFNGARYIDTGEDVFMKQKRQGTKLAPINPKQKDAAQRYLEQ